MQAGCSKEASGAKQNPKPCRRAWCQEPAISLQLRRIYCPGIRLCGDNFPLHTSDSAEIVKLPQSWQVQWWEGKGRTL